jgi:hypothetical protein
MEGPYPILELGSDAKEGLMLSPTLRLSHCCDLDFTYRGTLLV